MNPATELLALLSTSNARANAAADGPYMLCAHLESVEKDKACSCGYRGGIYGGDQTHMVCEMGSTVITGEEGLEAPRYPREIEIATAQFIASARTEVPRLNEALRVLVEASVPMLETVAMRRLHNGSKEKAGFLHNRGWTPVPFTPKGASENFIAPVTHPYQKWCKNGADGKITAQALKIELRWDTDNYEKALSRAHAILKGGGGL